MDTMKRFISVLTTLSMLLALCVSNPTISAQQSNAAQDPFSSRKNFKVHPKAVIGSTAERRAAWERLTPEQRKEVQERFRAIVAQAKQTAEKEKGKSKEARKTWQDIITGKQSSTEADLTLAFTDEQGNRRLLKAKEREANTTLSATPSSQARLERKDNHLTRRQSQALWSNAFGFAAFKRASFVKASATAMAQSGDADLDGLPEDFENAVADAFTPFYHVSTGEPDGFAIFGNFVPQTVQQVFSPIPPISHFRVQPLGFAYNSYGQLVSVLRIDYLTLWNHDSGLVSGALCAYNLFGIDDIVAALSDHNLDNERSALLVAAPVSDYTYNLDPWAYGIYSIYTAAHENTASDQSRYIDFYSPVPAGNHIELALSRSKHATYTFNPNYLPLTPYYIIYGTYAGIEFSYLNGYIDYYTYLALLFLADDVFYACIVERFGDQGGVYAGTRINVGEPNNPINNSLSFSTTLRIPSCIINLPRHCGETLARTKP